MSAKKTITIILVVLLAGALVTAGVVFLPQMLSADEPTNTPGVSDTTTPGGTESPGNTSDTTTPDPTQDNTTEPSNSPNMPKEPVVLLPDPDNINEEYLADINRGLTINYLGGPAIVDSMIDEAYQNYSKYLNENISKSCVKLALYEVMSINDDTTKITAEALKKVNDFLVANGESQLDTADSTQSIAALWLAASLYYDPDYYDKDPYLGDEEWQRLWRYDIAIAFALAKYTSPTEINDYADIYLSDSHKGIKDYRDIYASGYASLFNLW